MSANGNGQFREDELVSRKVKVGTEWQTRVFPVVGGRLRILHESNDHLSIETEIVRLDSEFVVVKAAVESEKGKFNGTGTASSQRDARLADSLVELAETRAIARALRFGGFGVEYTGAEEVSHVAGADHEGKQSPLKGPDRVFPTASDKGEPGANPPNGGLDADAGPANKTQNNAVSGGSMPQSCGNGRATQAQCRALWALTKKARYTEEDIASLLGPLNASTFQECMSSAEMGILRCESPFLGSAAWTNPIIRQVFELSPWAYSLEGISLGWIIDEPAVTTHVFCQTFLLNFAHTQRARRSDTLSSLTLQITPLALGGQISHPS